MYRLELVVWRRVSTSWLVGAGRRRSGGARSAQKLQGTRPDPPHDLDGHTAMYRILAIAACGLSLAACSGMPDWMQFSLPKPSLGNTSVQIESQPPGAEARASTGQTCRTPCSLSVPAADFTVAFNLPGYQPQTVPVRLVTSDAAPDRAAEEAVPAPPRLAPNPVYAELVPVPPPPPPKRKPPARKKPPAPKPPASAMAPQAPPPPASSGAWPPPPPPPAR